jgi:hemolysin III
MAALPEWAPGEEFANSLTHGIMAVLVSIASFFIIRKPVRLQDTSRTVGTVVFCLTMIELYTVSALYHGSTNPVYKKPLRFLDHCSVFGLIAGTYTAYGLSVLRGHGGYIWVILLWATTLAGSLGKIFYFDLVDPFTAYLYIIQGWLGVVSIRTLFKVLTRKAAWWLVAGGVSYTIGALIYMLQRPFCHAVFHVVMMFGTLCHILSVHAYT